MTHKKLVLFLSVAIAFASCNVLKKSTKNSTPTFKTTEHGLDYMIVRDVKGEQYPNDGDMIAIHIKTTYKDSVMFDSKAQNEGKAAKFKMKAPSFNGDLMEGIQMMTAGDSAVFRVWVDSLISSGQNIQKWMDTGTQIQYSIVLDTVKTQEQINAEKGQKAGAQKELDEKLLKEYFAKNNIKPLQTESGLYYTITKKGEGDNAAKGQVVSVNYTGKTLDGKVFDSSTDPSFGHVQPLQFKLGQGQVIAGWDEGLTLMNKGAVGVLYIPSYLAYGEYSPDLKKIPKNAILVFDVELVDIKQ